VNPNSLTAGQGKVVTDGNNKPEQPDNSNIEIGGLGGSVKIPVVRSLISKAAAAFLFALAIAVVVGSCGAVAYFLITAIRGIPVAPGH